MSEETKKESVQNKFMQMVENEMAEKPEVDKPPKPAEVPKPAEKPADFLSIEIPKELFGGKETEPPKAEVAPEPEKEPEELKKADKSTRDAFAKMRLQLSQAQDELKKSRESRPASQQSSPEVAQQLLQHQKDVEELKTKLNMAYDELGKYSLEADPRFRDKYDSQKNLIMDQIKDIAKDWEIEEDVLQSLLRASPRQRVDKINEVAPSALAMLSTALTEYDRVEKLRQGDLKRHQEVRRQLEDEQSKSKSLLTQQGRELLFRAATTKVFQDGHDILKKVEGNNDWNKFVDGLHQRVQYLFSRDDQPAQAESMILGVVAPVYKGLWQQERTKRLDLEKQMKDRYAAKPKLESRYSGESTTGKKEKIDFSNIGNSIIDKVLSEA